MLNRRSFVEDGISRGRGVVRHRLQLRSPGQRAAGRARLHPAPRRLPPSIAALTSMRDQASPITADERRARVEKARRLMAERKIDALMLTGGTSLVYFSGIRWGLSERLFAVVLPVKGDAFVVCPAFEEDRAREQIANGPLGAPADVRTWEEHESPYERVAKGLRDRGIATGRLGIEETVRFVFSDSVAQAAPALKIASGTPVTAGCRMVKDAHELALMRLASQVTLKAYEAAWKALKDGMTQNDFAELVAAAHASSASPAAPACRSASTRRCPTARLTPQVIREGSILLIDGGCSVEGYPSDISRTFVLGKPTDQMKKVFEIEYRGADRGAGGGAARRAVRGGGRRGAQGDRGCAATARATSTSPTASGTAWAWTGTSGRTWCGATRCRSRRG